MPIADHAAVLVDVLMFGQETEHRPEPETVDKLDDRMQLLEPVLQRRAGQHEGVFRFELFDGLGRPGLPVLDPLGLVEDDQVGLPTADGLDVAVDDVVVGHLVERIGRVELVPPRTKPFDDQGLAVGEPLDLLLPLVLQRRRRDDQHALNAGNPGEDLGGGDGLDGLAQPHVVGDQAAAPLGGRQRADPLVVEQLHLQQLLEGGASRALRKRTSDKLFEPGLVADLGDEPQRVGIAAALVARATRPLQKLVKPRVSVFLEPVVLVEVARGERRQPRGTFGAGVKDDLAPAP